MVLHLALFLGLPETTPPEEVTPGTVVELELLEGRVEDGDIVQDEVGAPISGQGEQQVVAAPAAVAQPVETQARPTAAVREPAEPAPAPPRPEEAAVTEAPPVEPPEPADDAPGSEVAEEVPAPPEVADEAPEPPVDQRPPAPQPPPAAPMLAQVPDGTEADRPEPAPAEEPAPVAVPDEPDPVADAAPHEAEPDTAETLDTAPPRVWPAHGPAPDDDAAAALEALAGGAVPAPHTSEEPDEEAARTVADAMAEAIEAVAASANPVRSASPPRSRLGATRGRGRVDTGEAAGLAGPVDGHDASALAVWRIRVRAHLMRLFHPGPDLGGRSELSCLVHLDIDPETGEILDAHLSRSSGEPAWDDAAMRAVDASGWLPAPPRSAIDLLADGVDIRFVPPE